ncbi:hypothetical protein GCM10010123_13550 [Pilimelia anulata]|uniref:STAS domain-containing protein n=1 Tax=Pilimelia anulata TaxID=53371 RepID=A0A8J3F9A9_9ACTN|nr:STAS domain-containing protein [Pilimelia anulata]GGJ85162.1 hypothetical protein GCM10010123_13550 [Pilimelia anulata]
MAAFTLIRLGEAALIWADRPLDGAAGPQLDTALQNLLDEDVSTLVIDLLRVSSLDAAAVEALGEAAEDAGHLDLAMHLRLPGGRHAVVREKAGLRQAINQVYPCLA